MDERYPSRARFIASPWLPSKRGQGQKQLRNVVITPLGEEQGEKPKMFEREVTDLDFTECSAPFETLCCHILQ